MQEAVDQSFVSGCICVVTERKLLATRQFGCTATLTSLPLPASLTPSAPAPPHAFFAQIGRTSIVVAHRLSTIRNADLIALVFRGAILEQVGVQGCRG